MEKRSRKFISCRLVAHQDSGRIRWCVGHEKKWQEWLKKLAFVPIILLPVVIVVILLTKSNLLQKQESGVNVLTSNISVTKQIDVERQKRQIPVLDERFSHLFKHCYELYFKLYPESFLEIDQDNRGSKLDYLNSYFLRNFRVYSTKNHRVLKHCSKLFFRKNGTVKRDINLHVRKKDIWPELKSSVKRVRDHQSKLMKKYMNPNVDPCENFYEFACGNWRNYHDVPPDKITYDTFEIARDNLYFVLKTLLETQTKTQTKSHFNDKTNYHNLKDYIGENYQIFDDSDAIDKAKKFYKSCMNEDLIEKRAEKPLKKLLEELGGWPIITSNWEQSEVDLIWVLSRLRLLNNAILISQWIGPDIKDSNKHIIHIDQTTLGLPNRAYFLDETNSKPLKAYKSFILSIAKHLGAETSVALQDVDDIVDFETKLASVMTPLEERRNISQIFQRIQIRILIERYPYFNWHSYFSTILEREIDLQSTVACYCPDYIHNLLNLLNKTNPRIIQNYLLWRFIKHRTSNLDSRFLDSEQKFYHALFGIEKRPPRWKFCVSQTNTNMGMAVGALFVQNYFDENSKTDTIHITQEIMETFINSIEEKLWLDEDTKRLAKLKIKNMDLKIGFPDFLFNSTEVNLKYQDVKIEENFFFENVLSVLRHTNREGQKKFGLLVNKSQWNSPPAIINAYYSRSKNQIMFPAGILQPPFYHKHFPKSINFGGIGVIIGHEITHALDDKGRLFDHEGNLQFWWDNKALVMFYERSQCIIDQYGNYILPESNTTVDGILTQGENIADNGGLKQAFKAYKNWLTKNPEVDETLPDLDLDGPQLFFLNFAQAWCGKQRIESERNRIKTSVHSPGIFRVIGALSNSDEFSMVYNCSKNSPMNPVEKCDLW